MSWAVLIGGIAAGVAGGLVLLCTVFFVRLLTPSATLAKWWGGFYTVDPDRITLKSADNIRMLSDEQIDEFEKE